MTTLFDPLKLGSLELKNRVILAPLTRSRSNDAGVPPDFAATYYAQRATGGLLITEATTVSPMAKGYVRIPGIFTEEQIASWRNVTTAVHAAGGNIFMQLFHTGRIALPDFLPDHAQPVSASAVRAIGQNYTDEGMKDFVTPRELTTEEVKATIKDFGTAAKNAMAAGFDGVELHGANGYLVEQFLANNTNLRTDDYGGSVENRARFLLECLDAILAETGPQRASIKISPDNTFNDMLVNDAPALYTYILNELNQRELAYLHVASMMPRDASLNWHEILRPLYKGIYFAGAGFNQERGAEVLADGKADAIVYGVKFLANPDLPERFQRNAPLNAPDQSTFYTPGEKGYTDYPTLQQASAA
jgi:N-ethylmaleimide reductase